MSVFKQDPDRHVEISERVYDIPEATSILHFASPSQNDSYSQTPPPPPSPPPPPPLPLVFPRPNSPPPPPPPCLPPRPRPRPLENPDYMPFPRRQPYRCTFPMTQLLQRVLWDELRRRGEALIAPQVDVTELETLSSGSDTVGKPYRFMFPLRIKYSLLPLLDWDHIPSPLEGSLWDQLHRLGETQTSPIFDASEIETLFSAPIPKPGIVRLIDLRRAKNVVTIMLTKVKMPLPDMMATVLAMDESVLDIDQIENLINFCPTKREMELLMNYSGDKAALGECEQYFLELMKVPRVESKLRVFSFKIQFGTQITEFEKRLNVVISACKEVRSSEKLKEIMKHILHLGNAVNRGAVKGSAVGFRLESLLKLSETCVPNSNMTLMHYLCKVLASKAPHLLDFHKDLENLESASKIQMKSLAEETQVISIALEKLDHELTASESDGPVSQVFRQKLKDFLIIAETRVATVLNPYYLLGKTAEAVVYYLGEDHYRCPLEQVTGTLLEFVNLFKKAQEENVKQACYT